MGFKDINLFEIQVTNAFINKDNPYTPDAPESNIVAIWSANGRAIPDYAQRLNASRTKGYSTLDFRIDKKWFGKKTTWNLYFDVQNVTATAISRPQTLLDRPLDASKKPIGEAPIFTDANGIKRYKTKVVDDNVGNATPSIGLQVDF